MNEGQGIAHLILAFIIILSILLVFFVSLIVIFAQRLKRSKLEALNNLFVGAENEKKKISRNLHDHIVPQLAAFKIKLEKTGSANQQEQQKEQATTLLAESISEIRQISHHLVSHSLEKHGLTEAIRDYLYNSPIEDIQFKVSDNAKTIELKKEVAQHLFAIFKELHQNTIKHSSANKSEIGLKVENSTLNFSYCDNGVVDQNKLNEGIGLANIRSRVELIGGQIKFNLQEYFKLNIIVNNAIEHE